MKRIKEQKMKHIINLNEGDKGVDEKDKNKNEKDIIKIEKNLIVKEEPKVLKELDWAKDVINKIICLRDES